MNSATVLDEDNSASQEIRIHKESLVSSAQRRKLADISNLEGPAEQMKREETQKQQQAMLFSSKEYAEKLEKENMTLMKALAHRNKIIELSGVEFQKLRINLRNVQEKNLQLAQANSHMLAELNTNRDRLKLLQHELGCKNVLLEARKMQTEEQGLPSTDDSTKDKAHDMNHKDTKRKRTSRIKPSESSIVKPIEVKENANSKRRVSGVIDTTGIPEVTCQNEEDAEKGFVSQGTNQIVDNIVNKKFVLGAANTDGVHSKRQCVRRKSTRFDAQQTEQTEAVLEMDDAIKTEETARICFKRRSARLRPEEAEPCKSFHERDEVKETIKGRRSLVVSDRSRSEAVEPSESRHETKDTDGKRRVTATRRQSAAKCKKSRETDGAIKEVVTDPSSISINTTVQECDVLPSTVSQEDHEKKKPNNAEETGGMMRRTSMRRTSRHAAEKVQTYREVSLKVKLRRDC